MIFAKLYFAHLVGDFLLQPDWMVKGKRSVRILAAHWAIHACVAVLVLVPAISVRALVVVVGIVSIHAVLDNVKARLDRDDWVAFLVDQGLHAVVVAIGSGLLAAGEWRAILVKGLELTQSTPLHLYACAYLAVVFGGGYFVQKVVMHFQTKIDPSLISRKPGLPSAGKFIGWLERSLVLFFVVGGYSEAIGFLLGVKALARYPEIKTDEHGHFAEYFLVGTLASFGLALLGGLVLLRALSLVGNT